MRRRPQFTRADRLQHLMLDEVVRIVGGEIRSPLAAHVHVTGIRLAGDLAHLRVSYVMEGSDENSAKAEDVLKRAAGFVARELARSLQLRRVPNVVFTFDDEFVRLRRIRALLEEERAEAEDAGLPAEDDE